MAQKSHPEMGDNEMDDEETNVIDSDRTNQQDKHNILETKELHQQMWEMGIAIERPDSRMGFYKNRDEASIEEEFESGMDFQNAENSYDIGDMIQFLPNENKTERESTKVQFMPEAKLKAVHHLYHWSFAHRKARQGPWRRFAQNRLRFKAYQQKVESQIAHIFERGHRERIYQERFDQ